VVLVYTKRGAGYKVLVVLVYSNSWFFLPSFTFGSVEDSVFLPSPSSSFRVQPSVGETSFRVQPSVGEDDYDWVGSKIGL
jgi:hypothetical protein